MVGGMAWLEVVFHFFFLFLNTTSIKKIEVVFQTSAVCDLFVIELVLQHFMHSTRGLFQLVLEVFDGLRLF